jgi:hypothetical protein
MTRYRLVLAVGMAAMLQAASTTTWEMNSYPDFLRGRLQGVSLRRDGRMLLAPRMETMFASDQPSIWAVAQAQDGTLYVGTGHHGRVYSVDGSGKSKLYWSAEQSEVFALAVDARGVLYAGTSPNGKIYRIVNGQATEYFAPGSTYLWSLAVAADGTLYAGTGDDGKVLRITAAGKGEVWYATGQSHITALALDTEGRLLAGSEPNGILYRITGKDKAFVLYDSGLPEIRAIVTSADGSIYAAALGGSVAKRASAIPTVSGGAVGTTTPSGNPNSVTVTDTQAGLDLKPKPSAAGAAQTAQVTSQVTSTITPAAEISGVDKSAVYRIRPDNTVETLWTSKEENAYDLVATAAGVTFSTDSDGRIYRLAPDRKVTLLEQTNEGETTRLLDTPGGLVAATGNMGKLFRILPGMGTSGSYESPVHDSGTVARWGRISWRGENEGGLRVKTRTGNTVRPDRTWSDWSPTLTDSRGALISSPNARFIQWMVEFAPADGMMPALDSVTVAFLPQNTAPAVRAISITTQAAAAKVNAGSTASTAPYSITVTDTGDAGATSASGSPTQTLTRSGNEQINITWQAEDTDGDRLLYSLYFRGDGEQNWKLLKSWIPETTYLLDDDSFADGKYLFRVVASDRSSNSVETAREADMVSAPVMIDNTPPVVHATALRRMGAVAEFEVDAADATSPLRRAEFSVDASPWTPVEAADGVTDSTQEQFRVKVDGLPAGEHLIVVRVYDSAGNAGLVKVVVR